MAKRRKWATWGKMAAAIIACMILWIPSAVLAAEGDDSQAKRWGDYFDQQKYEDCITECTQAIEENSKNSLAFHYRGMGYVRTNRYDLAVRDLNAAATLDPQNALIYRNRAVAHICLAEARQQEHGPMFGPIAQARMNTVTVHNRAALADARMSIKLNPKSSHSYVVLGMAYSANNDIDKTVAAYNRALELDPKNEDAYKRLQDAVALRERMLFNMAVIIGGAMDNVHVH